MDSTISPTRAATGAQDAAAQPLAAPAPPGAGISADFDTFLTLLTAELRNQDPLNPADSTEFVAQLASFSAVEQQTRTNDLLTEISAALRPEDGIADMASWIGLEVAAPGPARYDGDGAMAVFTSPPGGATSAVLTVTNAFGEIASQSAIDPAATRLEWSGVQSDGRPAPAGDYTLSISYLSGETPMATVEGRGYADVVEVRNEAGSLVLVLANGASVPAADVPSIRRP